MSIIKNKMIMKNLLATLKFDDLYSDGGVLSLLLMIDHYDRNRTSFGFEYLCNNDIYQLTSFDTLYSAAENIGFLSVLCKDITVNNIMIHNQPIIINIASNSKKNHFVICNSYNDEKGFSITDPINGCYKATKKGLNDIWIDKKCILFIPKH
jgi:ABC-type bacteriocin/lantibiotic exporter with double-glycine peptidase domain